MFLKICSKAYEKDWEIKKHFFKCSNSNLSKNICKKNHIIFVEYLVSQVDLHSTNSNLKVLPCSSQDHVIPYHNSPWRTFKIAFELEYCSRLLPLFFHPCFWATWLTLGWCLFGRIRQPGGRAMWVYYNTFTLIIFLCNSVSCTELKINLSTTKSKEKIKMFRAKEESNLREHSKKYFKIKIHLL